MRLLLIGGAGFIGPHVVRTLLGQGHQLAVYHRRQAEPRLPAEVREINGDRRNLAASLPSFRDFSPDVVIDFILASGQQASATMNVFRGMAGRVVALSSGDVYRAAGILHGIEPGPLQAVPLTEDSDLRAQGQTYSKEAMRRCGRPFPGSRTTTIKSRWSARS